MVSSHQTDFALSNDLLPSPCNRFKPVFFLYLYDSRRYTATIYGELIIIFCFSGTWFIGPWNHEFRRKERNRKMRVNWINSIPRIGYRRENVDWLRKVEEGKCQPEPEVVRERHLALRVKSAVELQVYGIPRSTWLTHCMLLTFLPPLGHPPSDGLIIPHHTNISMQPHSFTSD